jgi:hypothetical protein
LVLAAAAGRLEAAEPAASTSSNVPIASEIKTQLLSKALNDFSAVTRIEVLVDASNTVRRHSRHDDPQPGTGDAIKRPNRTEKSKVRDALASTHGFVGISGVYNMSAEDHGGLGIGAFRMVRIKDGKVHPGPSVRGQIAIHHVGIPKYLFAGLTVGSIYAVSAPGFTIVYNARGLVNFAQGDFLMLGGIVTATLIPLGWSLPSAIGAAVFVTVICAALLQRLAIAPVKNADPV